MTTVNRMHVALAAAGLTESAARALLAGRKPNGEAEVLALPPLRHAYTMVDTPGAAGAAAAYEAGLMLLAHDTGAPVHRRVASGLFSWFGGNITIEPQGDQWRLNGAASPINTDELAYELGLYADEAIPPAVVVDTRSTLVAVLDALTVRDDLPARTQAMLAWWNDGANHAGCGIAVDAAATLHGMFAHPTAVTAAQWAKALNAPGGLTDLAGLIDVYSTPVDAMQTAWHRRWGRLRERAEAGTLRRTPTSRDMAAAMESMQAASDWYAVNTTVDPLGREAARWDGRVVNGRWVSKTASSWTLAIGEAASRFRVGSQAAIALDRNVTADIIELGYGEHGATITVAADGRANMARSLDREFEHGPGGAVTLLPVVPQVSMVAEADMKAHFKRGAADKLSWIGNKDRKQPVGRDVPWHVFLAAAGT